MNAEAVRVAITHAHHDEWARVVATLTRRFGDLDFAEESAAEAFATAARRWPSDGVPPNPGAWLTTTASRKAIDRIRRENKRDVKQEEAQLLYDTYAVPASGKPLFQAATAKCSAIYSGQLGLRNQ